PLNLQDSVLYVGVRKRAAFRTILRGRFSGGIPGLIKSSGPCSKKERQKPRWRVAGRRGFEVFPAPRWRAEPLWRFRTIRPSFARHSRARGTLVACASLDRTCVRVVEPTFSASAQVKP